MKSMTERQAELFSRWKKDGELFVADGVVNESVYLQAPLKILFLLKEVNGGEGWKPDGLCGFLREEGGRAQTWDNVARWIQGLFNLEKDIPWSDLEAENTKRREEMLGAVCVVNVKKTPGGHTSVSKEIKTAGEENSGFLKEQIAIYDPEIVICCGTAGSYPCQYETGRLDWKRTTRGIWYARDGHRLVIDYVHPSARVKSCMLYYPLIDAMREILLGDTK